MGRMQCAMSRAVAALTIWSTLAVAGDKPPTQPVGGKIAWVYDYEEGQKLARQNGKPLFLVFRCEQ